MINVAIMGHGVVGSGTAEILINHPERAEKAAHTAVNVKYILDLRDFPERVQTMVADAVVLSGIRRYVSGSGVGAEHGLGRGQDGRRTGPDVYFL